MNKAITFFSEPHSFWSGYFTSRPAFKFHERQSNALLLAAKQAITMAGSIISMQATVTLTLLSTVEICLK